MDSSVLKGKKIQENYRNNFPDKYLASQMQIRTSNKVRVGTMLVCPRQHPTQWQHHPQALADEEESLLDK